MSQENKINQKILINGQESENNVERATISFILAVTATKTNETVVFVTSDASQLCVIGCSRGVGSGGLSTPCGFNEYIYK